MILRSGEKFFTFHDFDFTTTIELRFVIENKIMELRVDQVLQKLPMEQEPTYKPYFDSYGTSPLRENVEFVMGLIKFHNNFGYMISFTVECRISTWYLNITNNVLGKVQVHGLHSLSEAITLY